MTPKIGAAEAARSSIHLLAQHLGEAAENLGRLLLGEGVLAVAQLAATLPPSCRCWCWWEMIPEIRHYDAGSLRCARRRAMRRCSARCACLESLRGGVQSSRRLAYCVLSYRLMGNGRSAESRRVAVLRDRSPKSSSINADTRGYWQRVGNLQTATPQPGLLRQHPRKTKQ